MSNELLKRFLSSIIILPISLIIIFKGSTLFSIFLIFLFLITSYEWIKMSENLIKLIFGIIFLICSFYSVFQLREIYGFDFFIFIVFVCIFTDLGGYFFGKFFKGPTLTKISPKKTYAGVVGSFILPVILILTCSNYLNLNFSEILKLNLFILTLIISFISQLGDLIISFFKRIAKIKDTGKIIPGHGGILDRLDGLIFVIPFLYILIEL